MLVSNFEEIKKLKPLKIRLKLNSGFTKKRT